MNYKGDERRCVGDLPERIKSLDDKVDGLTSGISKAQSHAHDTRIISEKTLTMVEQYIKTTDERYHEGKADHAAMWAEINEHSAFQNNWKGFMAAISFMAAGVGAVIVMVYNYLTGHVKF